MSTSSAVAYTIVTNSYSAHGEVLASSFREHNPEVELVIFNLDQADDLPRHLDKREFLRLAGIYNSTQLVGALKPRLIRHGLELGAEVVILFDGDIEVFAPLDGAIALAREHGLVLTPHMTAQYVEFEPWFLRSGMINSGFIAAGAQATPALDWWSARTARFGHFAPDQGYLNEQRWLDLVPSIFGAHVLRDPGYNVMGWNLHERTIALNGRRTGRPTANGRPLTFFHFCGGFDPSRHDVLGTMPGLPWPPPDVQPAVAQLCRAYAAKLIAAGYDRVRRMPYRFAAMPDGQPIDSRMRFAYREALIEAEMHQTDEPPNPFLDASLFVNWLSEPIDDIGLTRYLLAVRGERIDLRLAFPSVPGADSGRYMNWVRGEPSNRDTIPGRYIPGGWN